MYDQFFIYVEQMTTLLQLLLRNTDPILVIYLTYLTLYMIY